MARSARGPKKFSWSLLAGQPGQFPSLISTLFLLEKRLFYDALSGEQCASNRTGWLPSHDALRTVPVHSLYEKRDAVGDLAQVLLIDLPGFRPEGQSATFEGRPRKNRHADGTGDADGDEEEEEESEEEVETGGSSRVTRSSDYVSILSVDFEIICADRCNLRLFQVCSPFAYSCFI